MRTPIYGATLGGKVPTNLRAAPVGDSPQMANPAVADAILQGQLAIAETTQPIDDDVWQCAGPNEKWFAAAHGFVWLGDLLSSGQPEAAERALLLVDKWIDSHLGYSKAAWKSDLIGRRLANWVCWAPQLLELGGPSFRDRFSESVARQIKHLKRIARFELDGAARITAITGLIAGEAVLSSGDISKRSVRILAIELDRQVHGDGGHGSRSPEIHLTVLSDLILLRNLLNALQIEVPEVLHNVIDRMAPMTRFFRHGDGGFAQFNGGGEADPALINHVLKTAKSDGKAPDRAPHTGFERAVAGNMTVIMDAGIPNSHPSLNSFVHAGTLGFEVSIGKERLIVNCGCRANLDAEWHWASRLTAAHSTVTIADTNSCELYETGGAADKSIAVACDRGEIDGNCWFSASHDGYEENFGLVHRRRLYVDASGQDLRGEDTIVGEGIHPYAARFHLHPSVKVALQQNQSSALLRTASGMGWRFRIGGGRLDLTDSVYLGGHAMAKRAQQLVIHGETTDAATTVKWALQPE
ncbi:MAG: hypothetical protein CMM48_07285 [Rhodospirillaceae bacterium]|nr:hypothetical protein [Rhodospirillaceae bacterium]